MKRARKTLLAAVKLALVAAIFVYVFSNIRWLDTYTVLEPDGQTVRTLSEGHILGGWNHPDEVRFRPREGPDGASPPEIRRRPGVQPDGSIVEVSPGLPSFLASLNPLLFALGAMCYFVTVTVSALRWWWLLSVNSLAVTRLAALRFTWIGIFFNNVVPGQTGGDVVKALYIMKHCPGGRVPALVSVFVDRIMGLGSLALLGGLVVLWAVLTRDSTSGDLTTLAIVIWSVLGVVVLAGVVAFSKRVRRLVRLDELLNRLPALLSAPLKKVDQAIFFYRSHKAGVLAWLLVGMANHTIMVSSVMLMGMALGMGLPGRGVPAFEYFALVPITSIVSAIPLGPNGWGLGEASYQLLFGSFCAKYLSTLNPVFVMRTQAVALSVLYRVHLTLWSLLGGILVLASKDRVSHAEYERELSREHKDAVSTGT